MSGRIAKILLGCVFILPLAVPAFAAGNLERIRGTWDCNGEESLKLNPDVSKTLKDPEARRQALLLFENISFTVDVEKKKLVMSVGDEQKINHFMVNSDDGKFLVITTNDEEKINFEFKDDNTLLSHGAQMRMLFKRRQAELPAGPVTPADAAAAPADAAGKANPAGQPGQADQAGATATTAPAAKGDAAVKDGTAEQAGASAKAQSGPGAAEPASPASGAVKAKPGTAVPNKPVSDKPASGKPVHSNGAVPVKK